MTMSDTKVDLDPSKVKVVPTHKCGYCMTGHHELCASGITGTPKGQPTLWRCTCTCEHNRPRCTLCHLRYDTVDGNLTDLWTCVDIESCQARRRKRRMANPQLVAIDRFFEEREGKIDMVTAAKTAAKAAAPAKPKAGKCKCCDKATKGGNFLPGHDARYVSQFVEAVMAGHTTESAVKKDLAGISDALVGKFAKSLSLAKEKKAKAGAESAASRADKAAKKAAAPARRGAAKKAAATQKP